MRTARRARWPLAGVFAWFGAVFGSLAVIALDVQKSLGVGPGGFGALLAAGFALAACAQLAGGALVERCGEGGALRRVVLLWTAALTAAAIAPARVLLAIGVLTVFGTAGALNATVNACAAGAAADDTRRFVHYHAAYSAGAFGGAVITAAIEGVGASWRVVWLALALLGLLLAVPAVRVESGSDAVNAQSPSMRSVLALLRSPAIRHLAMLLFAAVAAASAVDTWGVRFLRVEHHTSVVGGAGAYAVAQLVAVGARLRLVPSSNVRRIEPVVVVSSVLAVGLIVEATAGGMWTSAAGLAVAAGAGALVVPLVLARSGIGARPAAAVAAVGAAGQLGFVAGPALVGATTAFAGSAAGLLGVAGLALVTAVGAYWRLAVDGAGGVNDSVNAMMTGRVERT